GRPSPSGPLTNGSDFTYGDSWIIDPATGMPYPAAILNPGNGYQTNNSELMAILSDSEYFPAGGTSPNLNHVFNPRRSKYLNFKSSGNTINVPDVGGDGVYRDPWG